MQYRKRIFFFLLATLLLVLVFLISWLVTPTPAEEPGEGKDAPIVEVLRKADKSAVAKAREVKRRHSDELMNIPGVVGHGVGFSRETGQIVIEVYLEKQILELERLIPRDLEGVPVKIIVTGKIYAQ